MFVWDDAGFAKARHKQRIHASEFGVGSVFDVFDKDGTESISTRTMM